MRSKKPLVPDSLRRELRHLWGAGILFFYYLKWPIAIGLPILYFGLGYPRNPILDLLWIWCVALIVKDFWVLFKRYKKGERLWR